MKITTESHDDEAQVDDNNVLITVTGSTVIRSGLDAIGYDPELEDEQRA